MPNAKVLESKKAVVESLSAKIKEASSVVFVDYKGITVAQDAALRKQFRDAGVEYSVVKNTLTRFAAKENGYDFDEVLNGTTAMASTTGDPIAPATTGVIPDATDLLPDGTGTTGPTMGRGRMGPRY